jgi:hypothetical protein
VETPAERSPRILMMSLGNGIFRTSYPYWATAMNWYGAGLPMMVLKRRLTSTTSKTMLSMW